MKTQECAVSLPPSAHIMLAEPAPHGVTRPFWPRLSGKKKALLTGFAMIMVVTISFGRSAKFTGKIVGYDFMHHASKSASDVQNEEIVVLETPNQKQKYVKVVFSSLGTTQIEPKYFDGTLPLEVNVLRDKTCDEKAPTFVPQVSMEQIAGTYLLTDAFKSHPPSRIKNLDCYAVIYKKKK